MKGRLNLSSQTGPPLGSREPDAQRQRQGQGGQSHVETLLRKSLAGCVRILLWQSILQKKMDAPRRAVAWNATPVCALRP
jgi:hypothetical protein